MSNSQVIIAIPPTTAYTVVFPFDASGQRYDCGFYNPNLTDGRVSMAEIQQVLAEIQATRVPVASKAGTSVCCFILSLFAIVGLYVFGLIITAENCPQLIPFAIIGFFVLIICAVVGLAKRMQRINQEMKAKCQAVIEKYNRDFAARGLRWHIPVHFPRWVELWKDYVNQGQQTMYIPPVQQQPYANYGGPQQNMGGQPQFQQQNYYQNYQGQPNNNMYIPPNQV